jgi:hypothetical protein
MKLLNNITSLSEIQNNAKNLNLAVYTLLSLSSYMRNPEELGIANT